MKTAKREWSKQCSLYGRCGGLEKDRCAGGPENTGPRVSGRHLPAEAVQSPALAFQSVDHVHGGDGLPLGVLGVGDGITDHVLQENLQDTAGLLVDQTRDTLDTTSACQTTDSGLGDALDVIPKYFAMTLGTSLSQTFASLTTARHVADAAS